MARGSVFSLLAVDKRKEVAFSQEEVIQMGIDREKRSAKSGLRKESDDDIEFRVKGGDIPLFLNLVDNINSTEHETKLVRTPFVNMVETETGNRAYVLAEYSFPSTFTSLKEDYYHLNSYTSGYLTEISVAEAEKMLEVISYILGGEYSEKIERAVFENNPFFEVFSEQFSSFSIRFKKTKYKDEDYECIQAEAEDLSFCRTLKTLLSNFLECVAENSSYGENWKYFEYRLIYWCWG